LPLVGAWPAEFFDDDDAVSETIMQTRFLSAERPPFLISFSFYLFLFASSITLGRSGAQPIGHPPNGDSLEACSDPQHLKSDPFAAACYWRSFLVDEKGSIPSGAKQRAYQQLQKMRASNLSSKAGGISGPGTWTALGPGNLGGRIRSIVLHPADPNTIWVGSVSGGVFKTTNGGNSWSATNDFMANLAVSTLVRDSSDSTSNTLYAGTGEGFFPDVDARRGAGIF
jgi:hypothetical protein